MRNLRKLTAVVIAVALVLTSMTAAFAASGSYEFEDQATVLKDLGIWQGNTAGDLMLGEDLTRAQGAVLVLKTVLGKTDKDMEAADVSTIATFDDASEVPAWAEGWVALAVKEGVMKGGNNKLAAGDPLKGKDLASMFMNALGFAAENDYATAVAKLAAKSAGKILSAIVDDITDADLTRDAATAVVFDTLTVKAKDATKTVVEVLVGTDATKKAVAEKAGLIAAPTALEISKVEALNLRELVITFNKSVVVDEAKKVTNYEINDNNPVAADVSADGKTVTLRTSQTNKMGNYSTDIKLEVLKAVGLATDTTISNVAAKDTTVPTVVKVEATGPRNLKVTFSEPLNETVTAADTVNSFNLDNGFMALDTTAAGYSGNVLSLKTLGDLAEGTHTLQVKNDTAVNKLVDSANYTVTPTSSSFEYKKDTSPLTVKVTESTETTATIQFSKPIDTTTLTSDIKFRHTYNTTTNEVDGTILTNSSGDCQTFTVAFPATKPFAPGASNLYIVNTNDKAIKDNYGNKLPDTTLVINTTADLTKPTVSKVEFISATSLEVTFSEKVAPETTGNGALYTSNYTLKDSTGAVITVTGAAFKADSGDKVVVLTTATMNGGSYTLTVKDVQDVSIAKNELDDVTVSFTGTDKVAPQVDTVKQIGTNKVKVTFKEVMDVATATDKSNWMRNGAALKEKDTIVPADGNKSFIFTFDGTFDQTKTGDELANEYLILARVKDLAGNWSATFSTPLNIKAVAPIVYKDAEMIATDKIKLTFDDEVISGATTSDFQVSFDGSDWTTVKITGMSTTVTDGDTVITLTLSAKATNTQATGVQVRTKDGAATVGAKNAYSMALLFTAATLTDKVAPAIDTATGSVVTVDADTDGKIDAVKVTYTENLYVASVSDEDYTVEGYEVTGVSVVNNVVTISVKEKDTADYTTATPKVTQVGSVKDFNNKNELGAQAAITATKGA